jgi:hypothetical protein
LFPVVAAPKAGEMIASLVVCGPIEEELAEAVSGKAVAAEQAEEASKQVTSARRHRGAENRLGRGEESVTMDGI